MSNWTLFSNHGHVLVCLARDPEARLRDVAADVGITERAVQKIVRDLQDGGMISIRKSGRRNRYRIHGKQTLRHDLEAGCKVRDLITVVNRDAGSDGSDQAAKHETGSPGSAGDGKAKAGPKPPQSKSEPDAPKPKKKEPEDAGTAENIEKQQGSLF